MFLTPTCLYLDLLTNICNLNIPSFSTLTNVYNTLRNEQNNHFILVLMGIIPFYLHINEPFRTASIYICAVVNEYILYADNTYLS